MAVNVAYEGVSLAEGVSVLPSEIGLFLSLPAPMPVGSRLSLERRGQGMQTVRVTHVREGTDAGVYIVAEGAIVFPLVDDVAAAPEGVDLDVTVPSRAPEAAAEVVTVAPDAPHGMAVERTLPEVVAASAGAGAGAAVVVPVAEASAAAAPPVSAAEPAADGEEDDTVLTATSDADKPDANGDRGARKARRGKRPGAKR